MESGGVAPRAQKDGSSVPGSASTQEEYKGSRKEKQRFEYSEDSSAGFVEIHPDCIPSHDEFAGALMSAPHVVKVAWKKAKSLQGNVGSHWMERNLQVYVNGFTRPIEFELTRDPHMKVFPGRPFTVSACFNGTACRCMAHPYARS